MYNLSHDINGKDIATIIKFFNHFNHVTKIKLGNEINRMDITNIPIHKDNEVCKFINTSRANIDEDGITNIQLINDTNELYLKNFNLYNILFSIRALEIDNIETSLKKLEVTALESISNLDSSIGLKVNQILDIAYIKLLEFYPNKPELELFFRVMNDLNEVIIYKLYHKQDITEDLNFIKELVFNKKINIYYLFRHMIVLRNKFIEDDISNNYIALINDIIKCIETKISKGDYAMLYFNIEEYSFHTSMIDTLKDINMRNKFIMKGDLIKGNYNKLTVSEYSLYENNTELFLILSTLKQNIEYDNIKKIDKNLSLDLDEVALLKLNKLDFYYVPISNKMMETTILAISKDYKKMYLATRDKVNDDLVLITLYDNMSKDIEFFLSRLTDTYDGKISLRKFKARVTTDFNNLKILTEGISIDKDGNVHIQYKPKKSYMDTYMEIHKILQENRKQKNVEGMKQNLVHIYLLLQSVEEDLHKKNIFNKKDELIKARTFLMNDFKTYLKEIHKYEPRFDLYEYFLNSKHSSINLYFNTDTVSGLKKLLTSIIK